MVDREGRKHVELSQRLDTFGDDRRVEIQRLCGTMAVVSVVPRLRWIDRPDELDDALLRRLVSCWTRVSDAGGAVGFPFLPVDAAEVRVAAEALKASLDRHHRLLALEVDEELAGWLVVHLNASPLTSHWAVVSRVQTDLRYRGVGLGRMLMTEVARAARDLGVEQLHIALRGGQGIEDFYTALGWRVVGRWPAALRLRPGDDRDEILMLLDLAARQ